MKKVFMVSYGGGHANIMKILYKQLSISHDYQITYLALTGAPYQLRNNKIDLVTISEIAKMLTYYGEIIELGEKYGKEYHNPNSHISYLDTVCYYGIGIHDLMKEKDEMNAIADFGMYNRKAFLPVGTMLNILKLFEPDVCVVTTSPRMEEATAIASNKLGIPVVRINDTPVCEKVNYKCDLCVMNSWAKKHALQYSGLKESSIHITGQPAFENDVLLNSNVLENIRNQADVSAYEFVVTFFTENGFYQQKELKALYNIANELKNTLFVVKIHPNQDESEFSIPDLKNVIIRHDQAKYFLALSNVIINTWSTTGMEAAMMNLPVIVVNFDDRNLPIDYVGMGIAVAAKNEWELKRALQSLMDKNSAVSKALESRRQEFEFVKNAAKNINAVIDQVIEQVNM